MIPSRVHAVFLLLVVLAFMLPFELTEPLFFVGSIGITNVELPLYALLALSVATRTAWRPSAWTPVHWAALAWAAAHLASAAVAEGDRGLALRFALRMCASAALTFPVSTVSRAPGRGMNVLHALMAGALLSAAMALGEAFLPGAASLLTPFKTVTAYASGTLRAGGPFQYPNPAALYWAAALPLLVLTDTSGNLAPRPPRAWTLVGGLLLVTALVAAGSRGGLLTAALVMATLAALGAARVRDGAMLTLVGLVAAAFVAGSARPALLLRGMDLAGEIPWFAGHFELVDPMPEIRVAQEARLRVQVRNVGELGWETTAPMPMEIGVRWVDIDGTSAFEEPVTRLPHAVPAGATTFMDVKVTAPEEPGRYALRWQLVGGETSFEAPATANSDVLINVIGSPVSPSRTRPPARLAQRQITRVELWRAGWRMWKARPLLGVGPDGFRWLYGTYLGPRPLDTRINANSLYVETLAERGLLGAASLGFVIVTLVGVAWRSLRHVGPQDRLMVASSGALLAFALHGMFDSVMASTPLCGLFWIHVGVLARGAREIRAEVSA